MNVLLLLKKGGGYGRRGIVSRGITENTYGIRLGENKKEVETITTRRVITWEQKKMYFINWEAAT